MSARIYGIRCWCGECEIEQHPDETNAEFGKRATKEGWRLGHYDGQAHYVSGGCEPRVYDPMPVEFDA
jgi:hypothetical protein